MRYDVSHSQLPKWTTYFPMETNPQSYVHSGPDGGHWSLAKYSPNPLWSRVPALEGIHQMTKHTSTRYSLFTSF